MTNPKLSIRDEGLAWRSNLEAEEARLEASLRDAIGPRVMLTGLPPSPDYPVERRGVYVARRLTARGRHFLYCVDRRGYEVARVVVRGSDDWSAAKVVAHKALDEIDPFPKLLK